MSPAVIDLTSSPEPEESPSKIARSALQTFLPRKDKNGTKRSSGMSNGDDDILPGEANSTLQNFQPRKQKETANAQNNEVDESSIAFVPLLPDDSDPEPLYSKQQDQLPRAKRMATFGPRKLQAPNPLNGSKPNSLNDVHSGSLASLLLEESANYSNSYDGRNRNNGVSNDDLRLSHIQGHNDFRTAQGRTTQQRASSRDSGHNQKRSLMSTSKTSGPTVGLAPLDKNGSPLNDLRTFNRPDKRFDTSIEQSVVVEQNAVGTELESVRPFKRPRLDESAKTLRNSAHIRSPIGSTFLQRTPNNSQQAYSHPVGDQILATSTCSGVAYTKDSPPISTRPTSSVPHLPNGVPGKQKLSTSASGLNNATALSPPRSQERVMPLPLQRPNSLQQSQSRSPGKVKSGGAQYTREENALLVRLKEVEGLAWNDIGKQFPGRSLSALQVHYSTNLKLKSKPLKSALLSTLKPIVASETSHRVQHSGNLESILISSPAVALKDPHNENLNKQNGPYTEAEDALLIKLKEVDGLPWSEMVPHFVNRSCAALQVRYSTKLKRRNHQSSLQRGRHVDLKSNVRPAQDSDGSLPTPGNAIPYHRRRRKRNNEVSVTAGFISWADVKNQRMLDEDITNDVGQHSEVAVQREQRLDGERAKPKSLSRILRHRELGSSGGTSCKSIPDEMKEHIFADIGPLRYFKGASGDVTCLAWAPDGGRFAAGSIAITDDRSMQYNRPCNLLVGDRDVLQELPDHHIPRPELDSSTIGNPNELHAMRETQDPRLFMTVSTVQFSSDSRTLYSAGRDGKVRAYGGGVGEASCLFEIEHPAPLDLLSISNTDVIATACHQSTDGSVGVYRGQERVLSLSPSRRDTQTERPIYPSALRWGASYRHNNLLLAGFSIDSIDDERDIAGETCLWDVRAERRIELSAVTRNVFDVAWNPSSSSTSTVFAVASTPGTTKVNKGMRSIVQCFAPKQNRAARVLEWECPAFDINDVVYCPHDDNLIAVGATDGKVYVWDQRFANKSSTPMHILCHGESLNVLDRDREREIADTGVRFLSWGATSSRLYTGSSDGVVKVWNPYRSTDNAHIKDVATFTSAVMSGAFSPDYRDLLIGEDQGRINLLSVGYEHKSIRSMQRFDLISAPAPADDHDERFAASRELLSSGQIELRPMGALPIRQAVQGRHYRGPRVAPTPNEIILAEDELQQALDQQNIAYLQAPISASQTDEPYPALREANVRVREAQEKVLRLQNRVDDAALLEPAARQNQHDLHRAIRDRIKLEASHSVELCKLDCNYLPAAAEDDGVVTDSLRSEGRIPGFLRSARAADVSIMTPADLIDAGLTKKCVSCSGPARSPLAGKLPKCEQCQLKAKGLTAICEICSDPIRPSTDTSEGQALCEKCNFACFRCGKSTMLKRDVSRIECHSCGLIWSAGVLGYELVRDSRSSGTMKTRQRKPKSQENEQVGEGELEHYHSRWQTRQ